MLHFRNQHTELVFPVRHHFLHLRKQQTRPATMATTLEKQINLKQVSSDTYTASWHVDWTVASS